MVKIYITRHGQNEDNAQGILNGHRDLPLTTLGEAQARKLADEIRKVGFVFDTVYTSPLSRASRTAEVICEALDLNRPVVLDSLIERNFGIMTGKRIADIEKLCAPNIIKTDIITYFLSPEGAETFPDLLKRARRVLRQIQEQHSSGTILLSTHGDFGKMLYAAYYRLHWREILTKFHFGNCELLLLAEGISLDASRVVRIEQHNH